MKRKLILLLIVFAVGMLGTWVQTDTISAECHDDGVCPGVSSCPDPDYVIAADDCWSDTCLNHADSGECYFCMYVGP